MIADDVNFAERQGAGRRTQIILNPAPAFLGQTVQGRFDEQIMPCVFRVILLAEAIFDAVADDL